MPHNLESARRTVLEAQEQNRLHNPTLKAPLASGLFAVFILFLLAGVAASIL